MCGDIFPLKRAFLESVILWPDAGAFHPIVGHVAIMVNALHEFLRDSGRSSGQYAEVQHRRDAGLAGTLLHGGGRARRSEHNESPARRRRGIIQDEEELFVERVERPF